METRFTVKVSDRFGPRDLAGIAFTRSDGGCREFVLVCHGMWASSASGLPPVLCAGLASRWHTVRFDFAGNGRSGGEWSYAGYLREVADIDAVLSHVRDAFGWECICVVGHSKGATSALLHAAVGRNCRDCPHASIAARLRFAGPDAERFGAAAVADARRTGGSIVHRAYRRDWTVTGPMLDERAALDASIGETLRRGVRCRVLHVHGDADEVVPLAEAAEALRRMVPSAAVHVVHGANHSFSGREAELSHRLASWIAAASAAADVPERETKKEVAILLGATGKYMAAARAEESKRSDALFRDEFAGEFAGNEGFQFLKAYASATGASIESLCGAVAARTRFFDDEICASCGAGQCKQVVVLAAGGDSRSARLSPQLPRDVRFFAVDLPHVITLRARTLPATHCVGDIPCDLGTNLESLCGLLQSAGFDSAAPTVWVIEGLLMYLAETNVCALLAAVSRLSAPRSVLLADFFSTSFFVPPFAEVIFSAWAEFGAVPVWGCDDPSSLLSQHGFSQCRVVQLGAPECNYGRMEQPSEHPSAPKNLLATATRTWISPLPQQL